MKRYREKDAMKQCVECGAKDLEFSKEISKESKGSKISEHLGKEVWQKYNYKWMQKSSSHNIFSSSLCYSKMLKLNESF